MNIKKSISIILFILIISLYGCGQKADLLNVPKSESITSIEVKDKNNTSTYTDREFINEFVNILLDTEPTSQESVSEYPNADDTVIVTLRCNDTADSIGFFVYTSGNKTYIEIPYEGIWKAPPALYYGVTTGTFED